MTPQQRHRKKNVARNRQIIAEAKDVPCADCCEHYPSFVMDFDHVDGKTFNIGMRAGTTIAEATLRAEIARCAVVCSNCHRIRTHTRRAEKKASVR